MSHKYTLEQLKEAVSSSYSIRQVLMKLNMKAAGGNYKTIQRLIKINSLDISHFTGKLWNRGKVIGPKRDINDYLSGSQRIGSDKLRKRLLSEGLLDRKCENCGLQDWMGNNIPLELDHIDGNNENNALSNLRVLCPNCHALTPTYRGRNIKKVG